MVKQVGYIIFAIGAVSAQLFGLRAQADAVKVHEFSFYVAGQQQFKEVKYGIFDGEGKLVGSRAVEFKTAGRSEKYDYEGPLPLVFFEESVSQGADGLEVVERTVVGKAFPKRDSEEYFVLFQTVDPKNQSELEFKLAMVDIGLERLPPQHLRILNLTGVGLQGAIEREKGSPIGERSTFKVEKGSNEPIFVGPSSTVVIALETNRAGWIKAFQDEFVCQPDERYVLVVYPPRVRGSVILGGSVIGFRAEAQGDKE